MSPTEQLEKKKARKRERQKSRRRIRDLEKRHAEAWYNKPMEDWDDEELARGRPRNSEGDFRGSAPKWISREVHEEAIRRFTAIATDEMRALVPEAIKAVEAMILNDKVDEKGKPMIPPAVRLAAAQWVVEHLVGKPKQRLEADISVKLQGILANVMVSPAELGGDDNPIPTGYVPAITAQSWEDTDDSDLVDDSRD